MNLVVFESFELLLGEVLHRGRRPAPLGSAFCFLRHRSNSAGAHRPPDNVFRHSGDASGAIRRRRHSACWICVRETRKTAFAGCLDSTRQRHPAPPTLLQSCRFVGCQADGATGRHQKRKTVCFFFLEQPVEILDHRQIFWYFSRKLLIRNEIIEHN